MRHCECPDEHEWSEYQGGSCVLLSHLPNLRHLSTSTDTRFFEPFNHLYIVKLLPKLESLSLAMPCGDEWEEDTLEPLKHLTALTRLSIEAYNLKGPLLISPMLTVLTQLRDVQLACTDRISSIDQPSHDCFMQVLSGLTGLARLSLSNIQTFVPAELSDLQQLAHLALRSFTHEPLVAIIPYFRSCTKLKHLHLGFLPDMNTCMWQEVCTSLNLLSELNHLEVRDAGLSKVQSDAWAFGTNLTNLELTCCQITAIPPAVCSIALLQELSIVDLYAPMACLPRGAYLCSLRRLWIGDIQHDTNSEALADAKQLERLRLHFWRKRRSPFWTHRFLRTLVPRLCSIRIYKGTCRLKEWDESNVLQSGPTMLKVVPEEDKP